MVITCEGEFYSVPLPDSRGNCTPTYCTFVLLHFARYLCRLPCVYLSVQMYECMQCIDMHCMYISGNTKYLIENSYTVFERSKIMEYQKETINLQYSVTI